VLVLGSGTTVISGLVRHKAMQDSQSIEDGCCYTPGVVERHQRELGIDQELERQVGSRLEGAGPIDLDNQGRERCRGFDHQLGQHWLSRAHRLAFVGSLPPSYEPSTPYEFP